MILLTFGYNSRNGRSGLPTFSAMMNGYMDWTRWTKGSSVGFFTMTSTRLIQTTVKASQRFSLLPQLEQCRHFEPLSRSIRRGNLLDRGHTAGKSGCNLARATAVRIFGIKAMVPDDLGGGNTEGQLAGNLGSRDVGKLHADGLVYLPRE